MLYITWNNFDLKSIKKAELKKAEFEKLGYKLIFQSANCLIYKK